MVPLAIKELRVPLADDRLAARSWTWVLEDLPALGRMGTTLERQFLQQNAVLGNLLQQQVDNATAAWHQVDRAPKMVSSVYPQAAIELQLLCKAVTEEALPPIWAVLANVKKKEAVVAVSQLLEEWVHNMDSFRVVPVIMPDELLECIYSFKLGAPDVDDITAGFSLFLSSTGSPEVNTKARERAIVYGMMYGGQVAPSLDQLQEIVATAPNMAHALISLKRNYQAYSTLLNVLMGPNHSTSMPSSKHSSI
jgi:hypothetical protein